MPRALPQSTLHLKYAQMYPRLPPEHGVLGGCDLICGGGARLTRARAPGSARAGCARRGPSAAGMASAAPRPRAALGPRAGGRSCGGRGGAADADARVRAPAALEGVLRRKQRTLGQAGGRAGWRACRSLSWTLRPCRRYGLALAALAVRARRGGALARARHRARTRTCARAHSRAAPPVRADHCAHAPHANACVSGPSDWPTPSPTSRYRAAVASWWVASPTPHDGGSARAAPPRGEAGADAIAVSIDEEVRRAPRPRPRARARIRVRADACLRPRTRGRAGAAR